MNDVEEIVAEDAAFDGACGLVHPSVNEAGDEGEGEVAEIGDECKMNKKKK